VTPTPVWRLESDLATLQLGALTATVRISQPQLGLHDVRVGGLAIAGAELLAPRYENGDEWPAPMDCFVRGGDLVVTYPFTPARSVRVQVYWRAVSSDMLQQGAGCLAAVDAQISVQTPLLDSRPGMLLCSRFIERSIARVDCATQEDAAPWVFGISDDVSYAELIHPHDVGEEHFAEVNGLAQLAHRLFSGSLEKGVILRARVRGIFLSTAQGDAANVSALYDEFVTAPLPLTT
jgi:hypothetical protein